MNREMAENILSTRDDEDCVVSLQLRATVLEVSRLQFLMSINICRKDH